MKNLLAGSCVVAIVLSAGCATKLVEPAVVPVVSSMPATIEGEKPLTAVGKVMSRTNARQEHTLLLKAGETAEYRVKVDTESSCTLRVRYSNDDPGKCDDLVLVIDGRRVGGFHSQNTRKDGMQPGEGWNEFVESQSIEIGSLTAGEHMIGLLVDDCDAFGIEIDRVTIVQAGSKGAN